MRGGIAFVLLLVGPGAAFAAAPPDACSGKLPATLVAALEAAHPGFRAPRERDNLAEDVAYFRTQGGDGCLGVAKADFDGDGALDALVALSPRKGEGGLAVVALARGDAWRISPVLHGSEVSRSRLYVDVLPPKTAVARNGSVDGPLLPGELQSRRCPHASAVVGATEHSSYAHCLFRGEWRYVWFSE